MEIIELKIAILQILDLIMASGLGIYLNTNGFYFEQIYVVPFYGVMLFGIIKLNNRWLNKIKKQ